MSRERYNKPSASGYTHIVNCPGSFQLEQKAPAEAQSKDAESGVDVHDDLEANDDNQNEIELLQRWERGEATDSDLSASQMVTANLCRAMKSRVIEGWVEFGEIQTIKEEPFLLLNDDFEIIFSGQPDLVMIQENRALILDYKSGWGVQKHGIENDQLRALAVLVHHVYPHVTEITAGLIHPASGVNDIRLVRFGPVALADETAEMHKNLEAAQQPDAPLALGDWCQWCKAKLICPLMREEVKRISTMTLGVGIEREQYLSNDDLADILSVSGHIKKLLAMASAEAKTRLEAGQQIQGRGFEWYLEPAGGRRKVTDNAGLLAALATHLGITGLTVASKAATIRIADLQNLIRARTGEKVKEVAAWMEQHLGGFIEKGDGSMKLEKRVHRLPPGTIEGEKIED